MLNIQHFSKQHWISSMTSWIYHGILFYGFCMHVLGSPPEFATPSITVNVLENLIVGGAVTTVNAYDPDGDTVVISMESINPPDAEELFYVAVSGEITITQSLDFESQAQYVMVVRATAKGEVAEQTVEIFVENINEAPEFPSVLMGVIAEDGASAGVVVTMVQAVDPDRTTDIRYTLTGGNEDGDFAINQNNGSISISNGRILNRTVTSAYALVIEASDSGLPPRTGTTTLVIGICNGSDAVLVDYVISVLMSLNLVSCYIWK